MGVGGGHKRTGSRPIAGSPSPTERARLAGPSGDAYRATTMTGSLAAWISRFPEGWWGYHWAPPQPMSAVEIVGSGAVDARLDGHAVGGRRAPPQRDARLRGAAGRQDHHPVGAGRLPARAHGRRLPARLGGDFGWTDEIGPDRGYLLINELSDHLPIYVWGRNARGALRLAGRGYGMGATMHADSLDEALALLRDELGATDADLAGLTIYLQYSAYRTPAGMYRRVEEAWHLRLDDDGALAPVRLAAHRGRPIAAADRRPAAARAADAAPATAAARAPARPRPGGVRGAGRQSLGLAPEALEAELARARCVPRRASPTAASATRPPSRAPSPPTPPAAATEGALA